MLVINVYIFTEPNNQIAAAAAAEAFGSRKQPEVSKHDAEHLKNFSQQNRTISQAEC